MTAQVLFNHKGTRRHLARFHRDGERGPEPRTDPQTAVASDHLRKVDWIVTSLPHADAMRLVRAWHYSGSAPNTSTARHGLFPRSELLHSDAYGVALWIPPMRSAAAALVGDEAADGVLTLSRLAIDPSMPTNAASFLLGASMRMIDRTRWPVLVTYADTGLGHTGAIYKATNWECHGAVAAGDVWIDHAGRRCGRKRGRFTFTAGQMIERGYVKAPALPKIRFVHDPLGLCRIPASTEVSDG